MRYALKVSCRIYLSMLLLLALSMAACNIVTPPRVEQPAAEWPERDHTPDWNAPHIVTPAEAEEAYYSGRYALAQRLAEEYTRLPGADAHEIWRGWRVLALAAGENKNAGAALRALDEWRYSLPGADASPEWCGAWYNALSQLPFADAARQAEAVSKSAENGEPRPATLMREAKLFLLERPFIQGNGGSSIPGLIALHDSAGIQNDKRALEQRTWKLLHEADRQALTRLMAYTSYENENKYPFALIRLESARRMAWDVKDQTAAGESAAFTREASQLADKSVLSRWNEPDYSHFAKLRAHNGSIALVLPLTGQYGNMAEKILRGAEIVRRGFEANGQSLRIHVVDSDQPGWLLELAGLPASVKVVGGPMRLEEYSAIKNTGFAGNRFFFSFLPRMDERDEGSLAWRFFPSRDDQVRVMLDYAQQIGIADYAVFAPDQGEYAQDMFDLFRYQAAGRGLFTTRAGYYPARQYQLWVKSVSDFLGYSSEAEKAGEPQVPLNFQAMFLPDNWSNSARIIAHVFYAMDNKILFLGTNLWEHALSGEQRLAARNYRLAVFPGAWDQQSLTPSGQAVRASAALGGTQNADFWYALGYDFALAAASLSLPQSAGAADVNAALADLPPLPWSGAPIRWDGSGIARQDLFALTPVENGFARANPDRMKEYILRVPGRAHTASPAAASQAGQEAAD